MLYGRITGWGKCVPEKVLTNADLEKMVDTSDEWIVSRSGIRERHIAGEGETTSTLSVKAARAAMEQAGIIAGTGPIGSTIAAKRPRRSWSELPTRYQPGRPMRK